MEQPRTISTRPLAHAAMDYAFLRAEGVRHLERLTGQLWTDYNTHDPGITILEQVCYALTDLAHRINYEMPDLLADDGASPDGDLYGPAQILTTQSVTPNDLRKLVIDVAGVKNAWIELVETPQPPLHFLTDENMLSLQTGTHSAEPVNLKGIYRILVQVADGIDVDKSAMIETQIIQDLHAHRGLCEDVTEIRMLETEAIQVQARVEIAAVDEAETILLQIYQRLADHISPPARFHSLSQLLERGLRLDEIYRGPRLTHGFIDDAELEQAQRRSALRTSDMIREIMDIPGVRTVRTISMSAAGKAQAPWSLALDAGKAPRLDLAGSVITLERNQLQVGVDQARVRGDYYCQAIFTASPVRSSADAIEEHPRPRGRDRRVGDYYSIQHQFPTTYGIGALGLPASAPPQRKAQAKQLQAYLMFFDQLLANTFAQLAHVKDLFSFSAPTAATYFTQTLNSDPTLGIEEIMRAGPQPKSDTAPDFERRNRFLNHLLARFAENFTDYSLMLYDRTPGDGVADPGKAARTKQRFLRAYPQLSGGRGTAFNYLQPVGLGNRSGLEGRIRGKLGLDERKGEEFLLVEHILLRPMVEDKAQTTPLLGAPRHQDPYSLQLSVVFPNGSSSRFADPNFRAFVERTVREETPAHLIPSIHWLDQDEMTVVKAAYLNWVEQRRRYGQSGSGEQAMATHIQLRDARDRLIDLLAIGQTYPLQDLAVPNEQLTVAFNVAAQIPVENSQKGVLYQLYYDGKPVTRGEAGASGGIEAKGNGATILLETDKIREDITYEIRAQKLPWRLFNVESGLDKALNSGEFPPALRQRFRDDRNISFSEQVTVEVTEGDPGWIVHDRIDDRTFMVKRQANTLSVCHMPRNQEASVILHQRAAVNVGLDRTLKARILDLPLLDLSLATRPDAEPRLAQYGATVEVEIENSQEGVYYQLVYFEGGQRPSPEDAKRVSAQDESDLSQGDMLGNLHNVQLRTHPVREDIDIYIRATRTFDEDEQQEPRTDLLDVALPLKVRANPNVTISVDEKSIIDYDHTVTLLLEDAQSTVEYQLYQRKVLPEEYLTHAVDNAVPVSNGEGRQLFVKAPEPVTDWTETDGFVAVGHFQATGGRHAITTGTLLEDGLFIVQATKAENETSLQLTQAMPILVRPDPRPAVSVEAPAPAIGAAGVVLVNGTQKGVMYQLRVGKAGKTPINSPGHHFEDRGVAASRIEVDFKVDFDPDPQKPADRVLRLPTGPLKKDAIFNVLATKTLTGVTAPLKQIATVTVQPSPAETTDS